MCLVGLRSAVNAADMDKTAIVTGANSGIGLETARGLARAGYRTVLFCRNEHKAQAAKADIDASVPGARAEIVLGDLSLQSSVRTAAAEVLDRCERIDVLVNNAGVSLRTPERTAEGRDVLLATNHLGPFLLTNLLLDRLVASAPARIVNVASDAHRFSGLHLDDLDAERGYGFLGLVRYGETKLMNILFTRELARRVAGTGVTVNCVHPGAVRTNLGDPPAALRALTGLFFLDSVRGAATSLAVATGPEFAHVNGSYFVKSKPADAKLTKAARNDADAAELWDRSAALVGL